MELSLYIYIDRELRRCLVIFFILIVFILFVLFNLMIGILFFLDSDFRCRKVLEIFL